MQDHVQWKLSEAYEKQDEEIKLELVVDVYNINVGHNEEMMVACKMLKDYAIYVNTVREYAKKLPLEEAVNKSIRECIENGVLADFLKKNRMEAKAMSIYEYDEEKRIQKERQDAREEGQVLKLVEIVRKMLAKSLLKEEISNMLGIEKSFVKAIEDMNAENPQITNDEMVEQMLHM